MPATPKKVREFARPIRELLCHALKQKLKSERGLIQKVAKTLDCPVGTIRSAAQDNKGGFDVIISAVMVAYGFDMPKVTTLLDDLQGAVNRITSSRRSDKEWQELDEHLNEQEKLSWIDMIRLCALNSLGVRRKKKS